MPELSTHEIYRYRVHAVPREIHAYKMLLRDVIENGIQEPVTILTDGRHVALEEGHKRVEAAMQLGIKTVPITIVRRAFGYKRRYKFAPGREMAALLAHPEAPVEQDEVHKQPAKKSTAKVKRAPAKGRTSSSRTAATVRK